MANVDPVVQINTTLSSINDTLRSTRFKGAVAVVWIVGAVVLVALIVGAAFLLIDDTTKQDLAKFRLGIIIIFAGIVVIVISAFTRLLSALAAGQNRDDSGSPSFWLGFQELAKSAPIAVVGIMLVWMGLAVLGVNVIAP